MKFVYVYIAVLCAACANASAEQPFQAEFQTACESNSNDTPKGFTLTGELTREKYCKCIFKNAMRGLTDEEKKVAAFYLLGQSGVDLKNRREFKTIDPMAMGGGAQAVGKAVQRCGG